MQTTLQSTPLVSMPYVVVHKEPWIRARDAFPGLRKSLTRRESEVLMCLVKGLSNKEIARVLKNGYLERENGITEDTVKIHMRSIMRKLGASNRTHAAVMAVRARVPIFDDCA